MSAYYDLYETSDPKEKKEEYALSEGALQGITDELCELLSDGNIIERTQFPQHFAEVPARSHARDEDILRRRGTGRDVAYVKNEEGK